MTHATLALEAPARPAPGGNGTSLHGEVLGRLRDFIVEGNLAEGARIPERQLCESFGVSRTPLREALKVLASEGLIDLLPNRGARVRALNAQDIQELFDLVAGLEALAGRLACESITEEEIAEVERLHHEMYSFYLRRDMPNYFEANQAIHRKIVAAARNAPLSQAYDSYTARIRSIRYRANKADKRDRWGEAVREHEVMLDALQRRDASALSDILFVHLRNKQVAVLEQLLDAAVQS